MIKFIEYERESNDCKFFLKVHHYHPYDLFDEDQVFPDTA